MGKLGARAILGGDKGVREISGWQRWDVVASETIGIHCWKAPGMVTNSPVLFVHR